jgi:RNA polymerase sigma-70 factor, ECF subfamily
MSNKATLDPMVLEKARAGDVSAFNQLVTEHWDRIFSRAFSLLRNREDAEEVAQDTFLRAQRALPGFEGGAAFGAWLYRIATNLSHNKYWYWHSRGKAVSFSLDAPIGEEQDGSWHDLIADDAVGPCREAANNEFLARVAAGLEKLKPHYREILILRIVKGQDYEEIAEELELSIGTVKSRISRAREALRVEIGHE